MRKKNSNQIGESKKPTIRFLYELKNVLYDQEWLKRAKNFPLYYIYRGIKEEDNLRYDITIIPPKILGREFVKTKGHYHKGNYGELYKVLGGKGIFLIQKKENEKIKNVFYIKAKRGDYILIPPHYGHTIINPASQILKIANWVSKNCKSDYQPIERKRGFCYYYLTSGWLKNPSYKNVPQLRVKRPLNPAKNLRDKKLITNFLTENKKK